MIRIRASIMSSCKPAESLLAERRGERVRNGRFANRRLEVGAIHIYWVFCCCTPSHWLLQSCLRPYRIKEGHGGIHFAHAPTRLLPLLL